MSSTFYCLNALPATDADLKAPTRRIAQTSLLYFHLQLIYAPSMSDIMVAAHTIMDCETHA
jgi:hypothetical protein